MRKLIIITHKNFQLFSDHLHAINCIFTTAGVLITKITNTICNAGLLWIHKNWLQKILSWRKKEFQNTKHTFQTWKKWE